MAFAREKPLTSLFKVYFSVSLIKKAFSYGILSFTSLRAEIRASEILTFGKNYERHY